MPDQEGAGDAAQERRKALRVAVARAHAKWLAALETESAVRDKAEWMICHALMALDAAWRELHAAEVAERDAAMTDQANEGAGPNA